MKLNLGCGSETPVDWINVDYSIGARFFKIPGFSILNRKFRFFNLQWDKRIVLHDLRQKFPWPDESVDIVYSSHTLEHFTRLEGVHFLREAYRVLKLGGILRIVVPDLSVLVSKYINGETRADYFLESLLVLYGNKDSALINILAPFVQFPHKCMYDANALLKILDSIGIIAEKKEYLESNIADINNIELESRTVDAVIIEGKKI